ncbi:MAG: 16S rRNA (cytosine(967)-C(5))-methyltransferase [Candidatus Melainabacteria bacterium GWF2_32_7]|nr:MAG: 16S rRNA (cytosine(967)-C(5))-methyltransferase [Candidatus Melainabacteria bacterium GWF2_32_7]
MDVRLSAVKCLIKILEQNKTSDEVINSYANKVSSIAELINLTAGTVKFKLTLDFFIENLSSRPMKKLSPPVKNILRAAIFELEYLKKPDYAVINSYVEISKLYDKKTSGFVNGILRNFLRKRDEINFPNIKENPVKAISINFSHPTWLVERWIKTYGVDETIKICEFNNKIPVISIRINTLKTSKSEVIALFRENNVEFEESLISDECLILKNPGNIKNLAGFKEGFWSVQGESSSLVAKVLDPQKEERILDLCAAPGGKTTHIAALMQNSGEIIAVDISKDRIKKIKENCERLGITCVKTVVVDASTFFDDDRFDKILIDAPCSNTGVFSKRPDARWKRTQEDIKKLTEIQLEILQNASGLLKEGGVLVYSTCSIEPEENILLVQDFLKNNPNFAFENISKQLPCLEEGKEGYIQILQSKHGIDGFFMAKLKKLK